jgi:hypothetical protein
MPPKRTWVQTAALVVAAVGNAVVGLWAVITPRGFYDNFPGGGRHWVSMDGSYDQHLVFDVGLLSLALTVTLLAAIWKRERVLVATASIAALVFAVPHLAFHAGHLDGFSTSDSMLEMISLAITVAAPLLALWTVRDP